jgi:hypothetical protein
MGSSRERLRFKSIPQRMEREDGLMMGVSEDGEKMGRLTGGPTIGGVNGEMIIRMPVGGTSLILVDGTSRMPEEEMGTEETFLGFVVVEVDGETASTLVPMAEEFVTNLEVRFFCEKFSLELLMNPYVQTKDSAQGEKHVSMSMFLEMLFPGREDVLQGETKTMVQGIPSLLLQDLLRLGHWTSMCRVETNSQTSLTASKKILLL